MTKNLQKIAATILFLAVPQNIEKGNLFIKKEPYNKEQIEVTEKNITDFRYQLIYLNEEISSLERKKDFLIMRLQENVPDSIIKTRYKNKLKETEVELKKYYFEKDSIYKLIKK